MAYADFTRKALEDEGLMNTIIDFGVHMKNPIELPNDVVRYEVDWDGNSFDKDELVTFIFTSIEDETKIMEVVNEYDK